MVTLLHHSAEIGLLLFLLSFIAILIFALTRTKQDLSHWADLPLDASVQSPKIQHQEKQ